MLRANLCQQLQLRMETVTLLNPDYELDKFTVKGGGFDQLRKYTPVSTTITLCTCFYLCSILKYVKLSYALNI